MNQATSPSRKKIERAGPFLLLSATALALILAVGVIVLSGKNHHLKVQIAATQKQLDEAKSDAAAAHGQLSKIQAATATLQADLDQARGQMKSLQEVSKEASAHAQAEQATAKAAATEQLAQLSNEKARSGKLQDQLDQATAGSARLVVQLNQAKIQAADLQGRLQKAESDIAELQPLLQKAGHMPVTTALDKVAGGAGFTLHITNLYPKPLSVDVSITGANKPRSQHEIIGGSATQDVGKLAVGDKVVLTSDGYDPVQMTVP